MTPRMQVVVTMAGSGERFREAGFAEPKPLIDIAGRTMIARALDMFPRDWRFVFICSVEHLRATRLREAILSCVPDAEVAGIAPHRLGPAHTLLSAQSLVADDLPTLVNYCDFSFVWDPAHFRAFASRTECDGAVLCYRGDFPHYANNMMYAYCREEGGRVLEVREKGHFTPDRTREYASSGSYYFRSGRLAKEYCRQTIAQGLQVNGEHYMSLVFNPMIAAGLKVLVYEIPFFLQWGTPQDLEDYGYWHRVFERFARWSPPPPHGPRLAMPMAGLGSRFQLGGVPKPLIPVLGKPMFLAAREFLPAGAQPPVLVLRREIAAAAAAAAPGAVQVVLDAPTDGQAVTTERALAALAPEEPVLVSSCDHGLLWDPAAWDALLAEGPDLVVVGQRGYPGARRSPQSFAYLRAEKGRVRGVSVKVPLSDAPHRDLVLVGTFYFRSARRLGELIAELRSRDLRVNGELYLDSVVQLAVDRGLDCRCFESDAYLNWGSPEALAEFSYWHRYFQGARP